MNLLDVEPWFMWLLGDAGGCRTTLSSDQIKKPEIQSFVNNSIIALIDNINYFM